MQILIALLCGNSLTISFKMFIPLSEATPYRNAMVDTFVKHFIMFILNLTVFVSINGHMVFLIIGMLIGFINTKIYFHIISQYSYKHIRILNFLILTLNIIVIPFALSA